MSYTKHNFRRGTKLTAAQLNEMDDQIAANEEALQNVSHNTEYNLETLQANLLTLGIDADHIQAATYRQNEGRKRIVDALEAKIRDLNIFGRCDQEPEKGSEYQIIPWVPGYTNTQRGVTVTVGEDQRLSVKGTADSDGVVTACALPFSVDAGDDYTMISNNVTIGYTVVSNNQWITLIANTWNQYHRVVQLAGASVSGVYIYVKAGETYDLENIEFMLCKGSFNPPNLPAWEPFVSGGPLYPAPDTPMTPNAVEQINIVVTDHTETVKHNLTIEPPTSLFGLGDYGDYCDPDHGVWRYYIKKLRVTGDMVAYSIGNFTNTDGYAILNTSINRVDADKDGAAGNSPVLWSTFRKDSNFWATDTPYTALDAKTAIQFKLPKGTNPTTWFSEHETFIWVVSTSSQDVEMDQSDISDLKALKTYNIETNITVTDQKSNDLRTEFMYQLNLSSALNSSNVGFDFTSLNFACDGDSTTTEGSEGNNQSWPYYMCQKLNFATKVNVAMGNATARDRTSSTSGTTCSPQWKPTVGDAWVDYYGLNDPNFAGDSSSIYQEGTIAYDQATANNCLYSHIGYYIDGVSNGLFERPDVFILAMQGVNDLWRAQASDAATIIGTVEDALTGSWENLDRNTILKSIRWAVQKLRKEYPRCRIFFKTASQKSNVTHLNYPMLEEPLLKLCRMLSVPVIDSYGELGVSVDFESTDGEYQWTIDGVHPTAAGYQKDGLFTAARLQTYFI